MIFSEKLKAERAKRNWSQEELAEKLFVSRQSVSKWETGQNYPSIEVIIKLSDLFEVTIDELLRSDEELKQKVIQESKKLAHPRLKYMFDVVFLLGAALLALKIVLLIASRLTEWEFEVFGGSFLWNFGPLILMVGGGVGSGILKEQYKKE
ncbi:helix-turn-helix domain-containing protein [Saccharibacillus sacchari]|uniref:helix-turn-helix domain-containing protein n=1 Tax=Saccharibacillus sacchari TaxID=456493 RepID=UPI0004BAC1A1|nr:helix-turn-helix transcriptional regulator [Saccharibacillus sacchari]